MEEHVRCATAMAGGARFLVLSLGDHRPSCLFADFNPKELTWIVRSKKRTIEIQPRTLSRERSS